MVDATAVMLSPRARARRTARAGMTMEARKVHFLHALERLLPRLFQFQGEGADLALNRPAAGAYLSDELPYSRDRYCCYRAHRDFICDAFQMAYRLIVDRGTPARPLDREGRVLLATRRKDCLPIELSIQMPDRHDRCGPTRDRMKSTVRPRDWRRIHHSPIFWIGIVLCLAAITIYVMSDDLAWRPGSSGR